MEARERNLAVLKALCKSHTTTPQYKRIISTHTDTEPSKGREEHAGGCSITQTLPMEQGVLLTMKDSIWPTEQTECVFLKGSILIPS